jgi:lipoprotein-anchoring transpeptidase ErfK/SrfK
VPRSFPCVTSALRRPAQKPMAFTAAATLIALLAADAIITAEPAMAQQGFGNFYTYQGPRPRRTIKRKRVEQPETAQKNDAKPDAAKKEAEKKSGPTHPVYVVVSLGDQHASVYDPNGFVTRTRVSTGQAGHRTPTGVFSVIGKSRWHRSNIYSGAPMPYMQRITWSGVAMHAGVVPGYPASHGCIRLPAGFAPQLFGMTRMGARVVVSPTDIRPVEFSHPLLPLPKMHEAPTIPASPTQQAASSPSVELASMDTAAVEGGSAAAATPKLLNPIDYAKALKQRALADRSAADLAAKNALAAAQAAGGEARQAVDNVRKAEADLKSAEARLAVIEARAAAPAPPAAAPEAAPSATPAQSIESEKTAAQADVARAQAALADARAREETKSQAAFAAVEAYKSATQRATAAAKLVDEADRRGEQVSVFVSRKEGRVFIRQNWTEVWEAPVTIRDPDRPLGTHVYTAVEAAPDGSSMRWTALSMPPESAAPPSRRGRDKDKQEAPQPAAAPETAAGALDRIELPEGARERIAELLWTGGSLIVSDHPRSLEMSENATDFIVLTR